MASRTFGDNQPAHDRPDPPPPTLSPVDDVEPTAGPMLMEITNAVVAACKKLGVLPFANYNRIHVVPPLNISDEDARRGLAVIDEALAVADAAVTG